MSDAFRPDWQTYNVEKESKDPTSHLSNFKALVKLRQEPVFRVATNLRLIDLRHDDIFAFTREMKTGSNYVIVLNFGHDGKKVTIDYGLATGAGEIKVRSANGAKQVGDKIDFSKPLELSDAEGYVIKLLS